MVVPVTVIGEQFTFRLKIMYRDRNIGDSYALVATVIILSLLPVSRVVAFHTHKECDHCPR